jgi:hypothetical protein
VHVEISLEAAVLGWLATRRESGPSDRPGPPLIEVLAADLGLDPNPATLDALATILATLEHEERIVLDGPVASARDLAPLDLVGDVRSNARPAPARPAPRITTYSEVASAPRHVQLNWALRALRDQTELGTGFGELDFRHTIAELGLNPKDVRHALETMRLLRRTAGAGPDGQETWWVDQHAIVTEAAVAELERPPMTEEESVPLENVASENPAARPPAPVRPLLGDLGPVVDSLVRLEPRLVDLIHQLVAAAESLHTMARSQAHLLHEQTQEIEALREDRQQLRRDASDLRQEIWTLKRSGTRSPAAEELAGEAAKLRAADRRFAGTATEIADKVRRVNRGLGEIATEGDDAPG